MFRLIKFLFTGDWHLHKWEILRETRCGDNDGGSWIRYYLKCNHCGIVKIVDDD